MAKIKDIKNNSVQSKVPIKALKNGSVVKKKDQKFKNTPSGKIALINGRKAKDNNNKIQKNQAGNQTNNSSQKSPQNKGKKFNNKQSLTPVNNAPQKRNSNQLAYNKAENTQNKKLAQGKPSATPAKTPNKKLQLVKTEEDSDEDINEGIVIKEEVSIAEDEGDSEEDDSDDDVPDIFGTSLAENSDEDDDDFDEEDEEDVTEKKGIKMFAGLKPKIEKPDINIKIKQEKVDDSNVSTNSTLVKVKTEPVDEDDDDNDEDDDDDDEEAEDEEDEEEDDDDDDDDDGDDDKEEEEEEDDEDEEEEDTAPGLKDLLGNSIVDDDDDDEDFNEDEEDDEDDDISDEDEEEEDASNTKTRKAVNLGSKETRSKSKQNNKKAESDEDEEEEEEEEKDNKGKSNVTERKILTPEEKLEIAKRTIFIGNVPKNVKENDVKKQFSKFGSIENMRIRGIIPENVKISKRVAAIKKQVHPRVTSIIVYITYKSEESAKKALCMNGKIFEGHYLRVDSAIKSERTVHDQKKAIFLGNLPFTVDDNTIWKHFSQCGDIISVHIIRDRMSGVGRGFGFVNFKNEDSVALALEMDGSILKNREVRVKTCSDKDPKSKERTNKYKRPSEKSESESSPKKLKNNSEKAINTAANVKQQRKEKSRKTSEGEENSKPKQKAKSFQGQKADIKKTKKLNTMEKKKKIVAAKLLAKPIKPGKK